MADEKKKCSWGVGFLLFAITLAGGWLRLHDLGGPSLWLDEAFSAVHAQAIRAHGYPLLATGHTSWTYFPLHYLMAAGQTLTSDLQAGARLPSALAGTLLIPVFFWFNLRATGSRLQAIAAAFVLAFLTYEIAWSRQARGYVLLQLVGILTLSCVLEYLQAQRRSFLWAGATGVLAAPFVHPAGVFYGLATGLLLLPGLNHLAGRNRRTGWISIAVFTALAFALSYQSLARVMDRFQGHEHPTYGMAYLRFLTAIFGPVLFWIPLGAGPAFGARRRTLLPIALATLLYLLLVSFQTSLIHHRYLLPALPFLITLATAGGAGSLLWLWARGSRGFRVLALLIALLVAGSMTGLRINLRPYRQYVLGYTEPQADWAAAYRWVAQDAARRGQAPDQIQTISTFPVFHVLYLGKGGAKFYLPLSLTGRSDEVWSSASYVQAETVDSLEAFSQLAGYAVLDHMGFEMMTSRAIRQELARLKPAAVFPGSEETVVWRLEPRIPQRTLLPNLRAGQPRTVVLYGTSLTAQGAWVEQLQSRMDHAFPGQVTWINGAIPGLWSGPALAHLDDRVLRHHPDAVFLEFTINDAFQDSRTSVEEARYNLNEMINRIVEQNPRCEIILMILNPPLGRHRTERPHLAEYLEMYRTAARLRGCLLIDLSPAWQAALAQGERQAAELLPDGLHPSAAGDHLITAPAIARELGLTPP